jgi:hypothetical protein
MLPQVDQVVAIIIDEDGVVVIATAVQAFKCREVVDGAHGIVVVVL